MSSINSIAAQLAHEGGWDEVLLVGGPIVLIIGLLAIAKRRVDALAADRPPDRVGGDRPGDDHAADQA